MFIASIKRITGLAAVILLLPLALSAQVPAVEPAEQKDMAQELFAQGNYRAACEIYESLLERYPKDAKVSYFVGRCYYEMNKDPERSIKLLKFASTQPQAPKDVYYYLGKAYQKNYQFSQAKAAFNTFEETASRSLIKELEPEINIDHSVNAGDLTLKYNPFEILASSLFTFSDSSYVKQVIAKGGRLQNKPAEFFNGSEKEGDLTSYMFIPQVVNKGDYLYFSGYAKSRSTDSDLFRVRKTNGKIWGSPELLKSLNTDQDEILPYFDPISNDLYFASKSNKSMGGFDIFKSHYDSERDEWSEIVNLGFPVNSPDNEYIAMPGRDLGTVLLITDRQGLDSMLTVYKLALQEPKKSLTSATGEEIRRIGNLGGIESIPAIVDITESGSSENEETTDISEDTGEKIQELQKTDNRYQLTVSEGLRYQKMADSLSMLARQTRVKVRSMHNPDDRWAWQRQIIEWEKQAKDYSLKAEKILASANLQEEKQAEKSIAPPPGMEKDTVINDISLYKYKMEEKTENMADKPATATKKPTARQVATGTQAIVSTAALNRFVILDRSPYNNNNPIIEESDLPDGSYYKIQLGVFSRKLEYDSFGGLSPVTMEELKDRNLFKYYSGQFSRYEDARNALRKVKEYGYGDAYIVSWYNGEKTPVSRVMELEKR